jgi:acyl-CoA reductase-like NAD-dependent aldehyde dehydrogenase
VAVARPRRAAKHPPWRSAYSSLLGLGGKSANIVFDDADVAAAVQGAQQAIFAGAGPSCVAGSRLLVQRSLHDRFVAALAEAATQSKAVWIETAETPALGFGHRPAGS